MPLLLLLISAHEVQALPLLLLLLSDDRRLMIIEKLSWEVEETKNRQSNNCLYRDEFAAPSPHCQQRWFNFLFLSFVVFPIDRSIGICCCCRCCVCKIAKHSTCHKHYSLLPMRHAPDQLCCCIFYCSLIGTHVCALFLVCLCPLPSSRGT